MTFGPIDTPWIQLSDCCSCQVSWTLLIPGNNLIKIRLLSLHTIVEDLVTYAQLHQRQGHRGHQGGRLHLHLHPSDGSASA
jgi:hypothetical protein